MTTDPRLHDVTCRHCGRGVKPHPAGGRLIHRSSGAVAACDLDSDHIPTPDWRPLGTVTCGRCGEPAEATGSGGLAHVDRARDGDHTPDPWAR